MSKIYFFKIPDPGSGLISGPAYFGIYENLENGIFRDRDIKIPRDSGPGRDSAHACPEVSLTMAVTAIVFVENL